MSLDLRLLPFDFDGSWAFSHTVLSCENGEGLNRAVKEFNIQQLPVPRDFNTFTSREITPEHKEGETHYGNTQTTPYGERLTFTTISELRRLVGTSAVSGSQKNRAIWAYLEQLDDDTKVALFWH